MSKKTIKELAEEIGVSKTAISKKVTETQKKKWSRLLQFNQSKSARNVNFIMFLALFTCFYIVYMDVYML